MKRFIFILCTAGLLAACNQDNGIQPTSDQPTSKVNIVTTRPSPYLNAYYSDCELFAQMYYMNCGLQNRLSSGEYERNVGPHTIYLDDDNNIGLMITDSYTMDTTNKAEIVFYIKRDVAVISNKQKGSVSKKIPGKRFTESTGFSMSVGSAAPITIIRPYSYVGQEIPLCYYDDMEIEWNPDPENNNGVVVIIEWNGIMVDGPNSNTNVVGIDILDDTGVAVLNNQIFDGIPDGAMVNMWLLRGNIVQLLENEEELTLEDLLNICESGDAQTIEEYFAENPELILQLQQTIVASGACACFTFFLVRDL